MKLEERFIKYVKIDTQSDPESNTSPSTKKQFDLLNVLKEELEALKLNPILDDKGYLYLKLNGNAKAKYSVGFIAHVDTASDASGKDVKPRIIEKYDGKEIILNDKLSMSPENFPSLNKVIGDRIIVTNGKTLLGADDKLGVAIIMQMIEEIVNKNISHGDIYICFTPDEEIGRGTDFFNFDLFKADFAYTLDGSCVGGLAYENFNAAKAIVKAIGKSIHPGDAKNKMVNAVNLVMEFDSMLPKQARPEYTEQRDGFNHVTGISGDVENAKISYIIRNHDFKIFEKQKKEFKDIENFLNKKNGYKAINTKITDQYYNMYKFYDKNKHVINIAVEAIKNTGLEYIPSIVRGGTDGAMLSFKGLFTPNLGTGGFQFHGPFEFASMNQANKALEVNLEIIKLLLDK